jgi:hypothetical protein
MILRVGHKANRQERAAGWWVVLAGLAVLTGLAAAAWLPWAHTAAGDGPTDKVRSPQHVIILQIILKRLHM